MRRRWYDPYDVDAPELPDRPVSLVKDRASEMFAHWTTDWADVGWMHPGPRDPGGEGPATPPGSPDDDTPVAVPVNGAFLVVDGVVRPVTDHWPNLGPTYDGRIRWGVVTRYEGDERE